MMIRAQKGFTLLIAVVFSAVVLSLGTALLDIAYKQILLASSAKQSEVAFYNADAALECALYYDQQQNAFNPANPSSSVTCDTRTSNFVPNIAGGVNTSNFDLSCAAGGTSAHVTVIKAISGNTSIYTTGYSNCNTSDTRRVERGLKAAYP